MASCHSLFSVCIQQLELAVAVILMHPPSRTHARAHTYTHTHTHTCRPGLHQRPQRYVCGVYLYLSSFTHACTKSFKFLHECFRHIFLRDVMRVCHHHYHRPPAHACAGNAPSPPTTHTHTPPPPSGGFGLIVGSRDSFLLRKIAQDAHHTHTHTRAHTHTHARRHQVVSS